MSVLDAGSRVRARGSRWRLFRNTILVALTVLLVACVALVWYVRTDSFREMVRARFISALENITGGRVEVGKLSIVPFRFRVEARDLTIHGSEPAGALPYAHVDQLSAEIKIISIAEREYGFRSLVLEHPVVHIMVAKDGLTNQPAPKVPASSTGSLIQHLFAVSINHLQVTRGELFWNDQKLPLQLHANGVATTMRYSFLHRAYEALLNFNKLEAAFDDQPPLTSRLTAQLSLGQKYAALHSFDWYSGSSHLQGSGSLENFQNPKLSGTYSGRLDLSDVASIRKVPELRAGFLDISGKMTWAPQDFLFMGKAEVTGLEWHDKVGSVRNVSGSANYALSASALRFSNIQAKLLGGTAAGTLEAVNWLNTAGVGHRGTPDQQKGFLKLRVNDVSLGPVATTFRSRKVPLADLHLAGSIGGTVESKWVGSPSQAETSFDLSISTPAQIGPVDMPISGSVSGVYRASSDELELANVNLTSRSTQLQASGTLSTHSVLRFAVSTSDLQDWQLVLSRVGGPLMPMTLRGRATFRGTASGRLKTFAVAGHLQANNLDTILPRSQTAPDRHLHWDTLSADIYGSPQQLAARSGLLTHGPASVRFDASANLQDGEFTDDTPITGHVQIDRADFAALESFAGYSYPVSGVVDISLTASGTKAHPHADGHLELRNGEFYGQPLSRLSADVRFGNDTVQLQNATAIYRDGQIGGGAAYNPRTREFEFNLRGTSFDLIHISQLQAAKTKIAGRLDFTARGSGTTDAPVINASVRLRDLSLDNERAGEFNFEAVTHGADMQLTGRSNFDTGRLAIDGSIHLRDDWPAQLALAFDDFHADSLVRPYLGAHVSTHVPATGNMRLSGPLLRPGLIRATGDLTSFSASLENIAVHNEGPINFTIENQVLSLNRLRLVGEGTDLTAEGTVQLSGDRLLNIRADGRLNLRLINGLAPGLSGSGLLAVAVNVNGTYANPSLLGNLKVVNGSVSSIDLPNGLSEMDGTLVFNQDRLQIQTLKARVGGGNVDFSGYVTYSPHVNFNLTADAHDVRLRPAGISATSDGEMHLTGTPNDALLSGDVTVLKLNLTPGFDFARYLETFRQSTSLPEASSWLNNLRLDLHIVTTPELQMEAAAAKVSGDADLRLRGTFPRPVLLGRVDILEGDVYFSGTKYRLERGEITFTGPTGIKPALDLEATTRVRDYDITLGVNGTPEKLNMTYRSEPPLPSADIVALLALGRTESESPLNTSSSQSVSQQASSAILSQALNATLSSRSQRLFGISRIKVDPNGLNTVTTPTHAAPAVTLEQQVSNNLTLTYSTEVSQTSQQIIQAEYNVSRNISILAVRDQNGVVSFDVLLRHRRK